MSDRKKKRSVGRTIGLVILGVIGAAAFALAFGALAMVLWNWLMPTIFGLTTINFWQAFGIVLLAKLLFGFGGFGGHGGDRDEECGKRRKGFKEEFREEWRKEWDKECAKEWRKEMRKHFDGSELDDAYEDWWKREGAERFEAYMETRGEHERSGSKDSEE